MPLCKSLAILALLALAGCGGSSGSDGLIPKGTWAPDHPEYWPYSLGSREHPILVHYQSPSDVAMAVTVLAGLDGAWSRQVDQQGWTAPPSDAGRCGPDGRFDAFLWRGINTCQVDVVSDDFVTPWGGRASFMVVDPWGDYGGDLLGATLGHEFNHACQAANDWYEAGNCFEMTASYLEQFYGPVAGYSILDFQARPDWSLLRDDGYATWYMYGAALYLHFLRDRYFAGDDRFLPGLWVACRNTPDLTVNSPNFVDALNTVLAPRGASFLDALPEFARWRYYAGNRDDGQHFRKLPSPYPQHAFLAEATLPLERVTLATGPVSPSQAPMLTGSAYLQIERAQPDQTSFQVELAGPADPGLRWVVQAVPGVVPGSDGERVDLSAGPARLAFASDGRRTLILTAVPIAYDPTKPSDDRHPVRLRLAP